ncbi:MAG: alpha/beta hydrolase [Janthinobacterium lividum]
MTLHRRDLLALSLAAGILPTAAFAQGVAAPGWNPPERVPLWPGTPPGAPTPLPAPAPEIKRFPGQAPQLWMHGVAYPEIGVFRPARPDGRGVLVIPGGGYGFTSLTNEGVEVAAALGAMGITSFVLSYRLPGEGWAHREDVPLADAQRAMRLIRAGARRYGVDPAQLGVLGFSAGGHLAGSLATLPGYAAYAPVDAADRLDARPAFCGLMYAVSTVNPGASHGGTRANLLGPNPAPGAQARYDVAHNIARTTPPMFVCQAQDDGTVPFTNALDLFAAARAASVPVEAEFLTKGGHGFGTRLPASNPGSLWPQAFGRWVTETLG